MLLTLAEQQSSDPETCVGARQTHNPSSPVTVAGERAKVSQALRLAFGGLWTRSKPALDAKNRTWGSRAKVLAGARPSRDSLAYLLKIST